MKNVKGELQVCWVRYDGLKNCKVIDRSVFDYELAKIAEDIRSYSRVTLYQLIRGTTFLDELGDDREQNEYETRFRVI